MARLKAVFFDLGGTLMEDEGDRAAKVEALAAVNGRYGIPRTGEEALLWFLRDLGPIYAGQPERWIPIRDHLRRNFIAYLKEHGKVATDADCAWFEGTYDRMHVKMCRLDPDAIPTLGQVRGMGLHVGLLSDVDETWVRPILEALGIEPFFDSVTTSEGVGVGKPNPRIFRAALGTADCAPDEAAVVGDSSSRDVEGAKAVGMRAIYVQRGDASAPRADVTVRSLMEAVDAIAGMLDG
jgi:2-haloacid dehalogenase